MKNGAVAALLVVAILAGAAVGHFVGVSTSETQSGESTTTTSTTTSTQCQVSAEGAVLLQVVNSTSGKPIPSVPVQAQVTPFYCNSTPPTTISLNTTLTNGTGFAGFGDELGEYHLTLYSLGNYFVYASTLPEQTTCVTLSIPSGETVIKYSGTFQLTC